MVFSSLTFLFLFLPLILAFYFIFKNRKIKNILLLVFSLIFYAWGEPKYIFLMLFIIVLSYISGLLINKYNENKNIKNKKIVLIISIILIIGNLVFFKYSNFIIENTNYIFNTKIKFKNIILPIGISFYTFQILSYIIDLYKNKIKVQKNIINLGLYVSLFPQLIAGPIVRYETIEKEISDRKENLSDFCYGLKRFILGLSKKVIIANNVAVIADFVFENIHLSNQGMGSFIFLIGMISYTLQIYYDFSGYSDMAIGLGRMFGFHFLENFNYPYSSLSITGFWRRWHISLSSWFKDYVYIPLGGNRVKTSRWVINILIVWILTGLWHGASWNFVIWGLYYGIILIIEKFALKNLLKNSKKYLSFIYTFTIINIGWIIFRLTNLNEIFLFIKNLFSFSKTNYIYLLSINNFIIYSLYIPIGIIFMFPITKKIKISFEKNKIYEIFINFVYLGLFILCIVYLTATDFNPFIYFRF